MPRCGSQCYLCDVPIRFDTYKGCSHACRYCFVMRGKDIRDISKGESVQTLKSFCEGRRNGETKWSDWNIPIHIGGVSDPLQPCEKRFGVTKECLKYLAKTQYPFIISTKGELLGSDEYINLLSQCNCVVQVSAVCSKYDKIEQGATTFERRLEIIEKISPKVKRVVVRIQPYMHEVYDDVFNNLTRFKEAGVYGVIIEGMKFQKKKKGLVKVGGDFTYPYDLIKQDFLKLKQEAHRLGLKIYAGENRIRELGDSLTCCGIDGLEGFEGNRFNLNHILNGDVVEPTERMKQIGTADCFTTLGQTTINYHRLRKTSFAQEMIDNYKKNKETIDMVMGKSLKQK